MFPKIADWELFEQRVQSICAYIIASISNPKESATVISVDEKTGIQALSRIESPMRKGKNKRQETEYERHGTTTLLAAQDVGTGQFIHGLLGPTRTEKDFLLLIKQVIASSPQNKELIILADQLNTHKSASLVQWIAQEVNYKGGLGKKGSHGILENMETRQTFLEDTNHRIRFLYTPKHCSWLNPIENWFGKLQRHIISGENFSSVDELENKIRAYIRYYKKCLTKPLNWKFEGFNKDKVLEDSIVIKT